MIGCSGIYLPSIDVCSKYGSSQKSLSCGDWSGRRPYSLDQSQIPRRKADNLAAADGWGWVLTSLAAGMHLNLDEQTRPRAGAVRVVGAVTVSPGASRRRGTRAFLGSRVFEVSAVTPLLCVEPLGRKAAVAPSGLRQLLGARPARRRLVARVSSPNLRLP